MKGILVRYMPSLYPDDLDSLKRILYYAKHMNGLDVLAEQFKLVLTASGMNLFNKYKEKIARSKKPKRVNWDFVKELSHTSYQTSLVLFLHTPNL